MSVSKAVLEESSMDIIYPLSKTSAIIEYQNANDYNANGDTHKWFETAIKCEWKQFATTTTTTTNINDHYRVAIEKTFVKRAVIEHVFLLCLLICCLCQHVSLWDQIVRCLYRLYLASADTLTRNCWETQITTNLFIICWQFLFIFVRLFWTSRSKFSNLIKGI